MKYAVTICLALLSALFVLYAAVSASWHFDGDPPILLYFAYCIDHWGMVPYRDFLDFNMPGAYWAYMIIGRLSNYPDTGFRICDLSLLGMLLSIVFLWQKKLSFKIAWSGSVLFGLTYLSLGSDQSLQREFIALVPVVTGIYSTSLLKMLASVGI